MAKRKKTKRSDPVGKRKESIDLVALLSSIPLLQQLMARGACGGRVRGQKGGIGGGLVGAQRRMQPNLAAPMGTSLPGVLPGWQPGQIARDPRGAFPTTGQMTAGSTEGTAAGTTTSDVQHRAPTGRLDNLVDQLAQFAPGAGQDVRALRTFDPLTGQLGTTQDELLSTGLPTDVTGATKAAQLRAGQEFDAASDRINELLASKGLLSSSARDAAIARERGRMGERVAAAGLEAEIGAAEQAAGRRQAAVGQGAQFTGQDLASRQAAGQLDLGRSGQRLSGQTAAASGAEASAGLRRGVGTTGTTDQRTTGLTNQAMTNFGFPPPRPRQTGAMASAPSIQHRPAQRPAQPMPTYHQYGGHRTGGSSLMGAEGGSVPDIQAFEKWLENIGRDVLTAFGPEGAPIADPAEKRRVSIDVAASNLGGMEEAFKVFADPELQRAARSEGHRKLAAARLIPQMTASGDLDTTALISGYNNLRAMGKNVRFEPVAGASELTQSEPINPAAAGISAKVAEMRAGLPTTARGSNVEFNQPRATPDPTIAQQKQAQIQDLISGDGDILGIQGSARGREFFQSGGPVNPPNTVPVNRPTANLADQGIAHPTAIEQRRQFFEGGGEVPGVDTGEDQIPALLRSEELVVTPELVEAIQAVDTPEAAMAVVDALKQLAQKPLEYDAEAGEHVAQSGGAGPSYGTQFEDWLASIFGPTGTGTPLDQPTADPAGVPTPETDLALRALEAGQGAEVPTPPELGGFQRTPPSGRGVPDLPSQVQHSVFAPPVPGSADVVPGYGGEVPTLRVRGGDRDIEGKQILPTQFGGGVDRGTLSVMGTDPLTEEQQAMKRIEDAKNRRDLIQSAMIADPVGGPEKFLRLQNSLENANREVEQLVNEVVAKEQNRIAERQAIATEKFADARLSDSVSNRLNAEANKATAYADVAERLQQAAAADPRAAMIIEAFSKMKPQTERSIRQMEFVLTSLIESISGVKIVERSGISGWLSQVLLGRPEFEFETGPPVEIANPEMRAVLDMLAQTSGP